MSYQKLENFKTLLKQISFFGDLDKHDLELLEVSVDQVQTLTNKTINSYRSISKIFNYSQTHHNIVFLYHLSHQLYQKHPENLLSEKIYLLNRMLNSIDLYFKIQLPDYFLIGHGLGTVFSNANYGNHLVVFQNVTIGVQDNKYPTVGEKVIIYPGSLIAGNTIIGDNSVIGAGTILINKNIPDNTVVYSKDGMLQIKENDKNTIADYFEFKS